MKTLDWLRLWLMIFYAPARGLREVRDRAGLAPISLLALASHVAFLLVLVNLFLPGFVSLRHPFSILVVIFQSAGCLLFLGLIFVPIAILLLNLSERRASYRLLLQQEYGATTAALFYAWAAASLITLVLTVAGALLGVLQRMGANLFEAFMRERTQMTPEALAELMGRELKSEQWR